MSPAEGRWGEESGQQTETQPGTRKPYTTPAIICELGLETGAGSPLLIPPLDPLDPLSQAGAEPKKK